MKRLFLLLSAVLLSAAALRAEGIDGSKGGTLIRLSDFGSDDVGYFSIPTKEPKGGIVLIHDAWGLNDAVMATVERLANDGFIVIAPDLFNGQKATDATRAADLRRGLVAESAEKTITAAIRFLRETPRFRASHVAVVGWGMGALPALDAASANNKWVDAVAVVGGPLDGAARRFAKIDAPISAIFDTADPNLATDDRERFLAALGKKDVETHDLPPGALRAGPFPAKARQWLVPFFTRAFAAPPKSGISGLLDKINPFDGDEGAKPAEPVVP